VADAGLSVFSEILVVFPEVHQLRRQRPQRPRPEHRDGKYQRGPHGSEIRGVEDEPDALPHVAAQGTQSADHAKT
jgi:hypothetical protein